MALNISWRGKATLPMQNFMVIFRKRRTQLAGHLIRHEDEVANKLVLWQPTDGRPSRGRKRRTYIQNLFEDTGTENVSEINNLMKDRNTWKDRVKESLGRPGGRPR